MDILSKMKSGAVIFALLMPFWAAAQLNIPASVLGNGSTPTSNGQWTIKSTVAQPLIGPTSGSSSQQLLGFWYQPNVLVTSVEQLSLEGLSDGFHLGQNFPNPANTYTTIPFSVPRESFIALILMNSSGRVISRLAEERFISGKYQAEVEVGQLPAGTYVYQLYVDKQLVGSRKMVVGR